MTRSAPGDISLGKCRSARSGPGASPHLPSRELNPISFSPSFPCYVKVLSPRRAETSAPRSRWILHLQKIAPVQNHEYHFIIYSERAGTTASQQGLGQSRERPGSEAGEPVLRPLLLKGKSPQSASGPKSGFAGTGALVVCLGATSA